MTFQDLGIHLTNHNTGKHYLPCPKCSVDRKDDNKKKPCLTVNVEVNNNWWKCHHCNWQGNLEADGKFKKIREQANMPEKPTYNKIITEYWKKRKISVATLLKAHCYEPTGYPGVVAFPFLRGYSIVNVKYRRISPDNKEFWFLKKEDGAELALWGLECIEDAEIQDSDVAIITEGEPDRLSFMEAGFKYVMSVPKGAPSTKAKNFEKEFDYLKSAIEPLRPFKRIILAIDDDDAGFGLQKELARRLGKERCYTIKYEGCKDANELLCAEKFKFENEGIEALQKCVANARPVPITGIIRVSDIPTQDFEMFYEHGFKRGLLAGYAEFDKLYSVKRKLFTVITGTSQSGKSEFIYSYTYKLINNNPEQHIKIAVFSPESRPIIRSIARLAMIHQNKPLSPVAPNRMTKDEFMAGKDWVNNHYFFINPPERDSSKEAVELRTLGGILNYAKILVEQEGIYGIVIDPWNKIEHNRPAAKTEKEYISMCLDQILEFAEMCDIHVWLVAHPTKISTDPKTGNKRDVFLEDISGAAEWESKPDQGIVLQRPFYEMVESGDKGKKTRKFNPYLATTVRIQKMKFSEIGNIGAVKMFYNLFGGGNFVEKYEEKTKKPEGMVEVDPFAGNQDMSAEEDLPF